MPCIKAIKEKWAPKTLCRVHGRVHALHESPPGRLNLNHQPPILRCEVHDMDSGVDFRLLTTESSQMYVVTGGTPEGVEKARATLCQM